MPQGFTSVVAGLFLFLSLIPAWPHPHLRFNSPHYELSESGPGRLVRLDLTLTESSVFPVEVHYWTEDSTAKAGEDYQAVSGVLRFGVAGTQAVFVEILSDSTEEVVEAFVVRADVVGQPGEDSKASAVVNILDADPLPVLQRAEIPAFETLGSLVLPLREVMVFQGEGARIRYQTVAGTARAGEDFIPQSGVLEVGPTMPDARIEIRLVRDGLPEPDEAFELVFSPLPAGSTGAERRLTIRVYDEDRAGGLKMFSGAAQRNWSQAVAEPGGTWLGITDADGTRRYRGDGSVDDLFVPSRLPSLPFFRPILRPSSDGQSIWMLGTSFLVYPGLPPTTIRTFRLRHGGEIDPDFHPGSFDGLRLIDAGLVPGAGAILAFRSLPEKGASDHGVGRLTESGEWDPAYQPGPNALIVPSLGGAPLPLFIQALHVRADGSALVGGYLGQTTAGGPACLVRLRPDGSRDPGFTPVILNDPGELGKVSCVAELGDGTLLIGGSLENPVSGRGNGLLRLRPDGSVLKSFHSPFAPGAFVEGIHVQRSGLLLAVGYFRIFGDEKPRAVVRLLQSGEVDPSFDCALSPLSSYLGGRANFTLLEDGNLVALASWPEPGGSPQAFLVQSGVPARSVVAFLPKEQRVSALDGVAEFEVRRSDPAHDALEIPLEVLPDDDAQGLTDLLLPKSVTFLPGETSRILRIPIPAQPQCGTVRSLRFRAQPSAQASWVMRDSEVSLTVIDGPAFVQQPGTRVQGLAGGEILQILRDEAGALIVAGSYLEFDGKPSQGLIRLKPNGEIDHSFNASTRPLASRAGSSTVALGTARSVVILTLGQNHIHHACVRLREQGGEDETYKGEATLLELGMEPDFLWSTTDFRVFVAGSGRLVKLLADGRLDPEFEPQAFSDPRVADGHGAYITAITPTQRGGWIVAGNFTRYAGVPAPGIVRITGNGQVDHTFSVSGATSWIEFDQQDVVMLPDEELLCSAWFLSPEGRAGRGLIRLSPDGTLLTEGPPFPKSPWQVRGLRAWTDARSLLSEASYPTAPRAATVVLRVLRPDLSPGNPLEPVVIASSAPLLPMEVLQVNADGSLWVHEWTFTESGEIRSRIGCIREVRDMDIERTILKAGRLHLSARVTLGNEYALESSSDLRSWAELRRATAVGCRWDLELDAQSIGSPGFLRVSRR